MPNPYGAPEISVVDVDQRLQAGDSFIWLDVREPHETDMVYIDHASVQLVPLSVLAEQKLAALPTEAQEKDAEIIVFCHKGMRSAQVVAWLRQQGWQNALNMEGGIDAWAKEIDPDVGMY
jgi:rhodanese-related sulfurtransferase